MSKFDKAFILLFMALVLLLIFSIYHENQTLKKVIEIQDKHIEEAYKRDSLYLKESEDLNHKLSKYVSKTGCGIEIDGKAVSTSELVAILRKSYNEIDSLKSHLDFHHVQIDSINKEHNLTRRAYVDEIEDNIKLTTSYQDTLTVYKNIVRLVKKDYGITYAFKMNKDNKFEFTRQPSKADSALWLLPYYRNMITKDPKTGETNITVYDLPEIKNKN